MHATASQRPKVAPAVRRRWTAVAVSLAVGGSVLLAPSIAHATPAAVDDAYTLGAEAPFSSAPGQGILANDAEVTAPGATVYVQSLPSHGALSYLDNTGAITYTPSSGYVGTDSFKYCVKYAAAFGCATNDATVTFTVVSHVERIGAVDRFAESAAISATHFSPNTQAVYIASGAVFPDALSAGAAAGAKSAPVLLVTKDTIPDAVQGELGRLKPAKIVVLGGVNTIGAGVESMLSTYSGSVVRYAGADRFEVSATVSAKTFEPARPVVYVASGEVFPDALSASAAAGMRGGPVLLVKRDEVPGAIMIELGRLAPGKIVVLGGTNTISEGVIATLQKVAPTTRIAGADRYVVSAGASAAAYDPATTHVVFIASGENYPDALSGSPAAISRTAPVLLVSKDSIPAAVAAELTRLQANRIIVLGGVNSISPQVESALTAYLAK